MRSEGAGAGNMRACSVGLSGVNSTSERENVNFQQATKVSLLVNVDSHCPPPGSAMIRHIEFSE